MVLVTKPLGEMLEEIGRYSECTEVITPSIRISCPIALSCKGSSTLNWLLPHAASLALRTDRSFDPDKVIGPLGELTAGVAHGMYDIVRNFHGRDMTLPLTSRLYTGEKGSVIRLEPHSSCCVDSSRIYPTRPHDLDDEQLLHLLHFVDFPRSFEASFEPYRQGSSFLRLF